MIEIKQTIKYVLRHPIKDSLVDINFPSETDMDDWMPYLNKFEDYLIKEAINALGSGKKQK